VLKPSEIAPFNAILLAEMLHEAGVPKGVFNLVNGDGPGVGAAMAAHPGIDVMSFTGSTRAGIEVAIRSAPTVKRVAQELGGKSPNILLDDCDFPKAVKAGVEACMRNSGQSCNAPTRMLVPAARMKEVAAIAKSTAENMKVGDPNGEGVELGPVASAAQYSKIQGLIAKGIEAGATVAVGGTGKPEGLSKGYYVKPTVFTDVSNDMTIAQEEIFGPVLVVIPYKDEAEAIRIANDTPFGLAAYVNSGDRDHAVKVAREIRAGMVHINMAFGDSKAPFGGMKQSGNGREWGKFGFDEYLEIKAVFGQSAA
jgi:aldehyde dehydrogenase (NAD+)